MFLTPRATFPDVHPVKNDLNPLRSVEDEKDHPPPDVRSNDGPVSHLYTDIHGISISEPPKYFHHTQGREVKRPRAHWRTGRNGNPMHSPAPPAQFHEKIGINRVGQLRAPI